MVKELPEDGKVLYVCEACGFVYKEREWAEKCQRWCEEYHSCNLEIMQHAISAVERYTTDDEQN